MQKTALFSLLVAVFYFPLLAQNEELQLSLQTDLLAYTTPGGWSAWATAQYKRYKLSLALVNYPNRFRNTYDETGIQENGRWLRFQLSRHFKPTSKWRNFHYGINAEYHWRELLEDGNPSEVLEDTHWQLGLFAGYEWRPWRKKENALQNILITAWLGANYLPSSSEMARVFENTMSIYEAPNIARPTVGVNIGYVLFKN